VGQSDDAGTPAARKPVATACWNIICLIDKYCLF
jgi:hypothetical protein